jgi:AraC family transcriptional regulator of adaptative response / DNA-3-methyladenine glycosylase II
MKTETGGDHMDIDDRDTCYEIFRAKDARYDGRFFIGITSTGIYCRPVCKARLPKPENCRYFLTAAEAEKAGFRPCMICRPELAPGASRIDASSELARKAVYFLRDNCDSGLSLAELSNLLGCSERHLRRVFKDEFNVTPVEYMQTCRLLLAKQLLTETQLPVLDVAMTAGFGSVRRMNELFRSRYGLSPLSFRRRARAEGGKPEKGKTKGGKPESGKIKGGKLEGGDRILSGAETVTVSLGYRPPYDWDDVLAFLKPRAIPHVEIVADGAYERTLRLRSRGGKVCAGTIRVSNDAKSRALNAEMSEPLVPVMSQVISKVRQMFDLDCDPEIIEEKLEGLKPYLPNGIVKGIRVPGCFDAFEMACRAIIGQQITVKAATTLIGRVAEACGGMIETGIEGLDRTFPDSREIAAMGGADGRGVTDDFGKLGVIASRSNAIYSLACALTEENGLRLDRAADPETEMERLKKIRGIGNWTAQYVAMRTMGWTDAFMETDAGIRKALPDMTDKERLKISEKWKPWRSYAMMELWRG